jgi:AcrR family transcriptional regulator
MKVQNPVTYRIRRETLLQLARHLFATKGYAETSMDDIAHACSMQKASLYHYFTSKQQILQEMVNWEVSRWWAVRLKDYETGADLRQTLELIGTNFLKDLEDPSRREFFKIIHFESHKNPAILKALKESPTHNREGFYSVFAKHLQGRLPKKQIAMFMTQFMGGLIHFATLSRLRAENLCYEPMDDTAYVQQLVDIFVQGIGKSPANRSVD